MRLLDTIFYWAKADPSRRAFIQPEMVTTYQALADAIDSISARIDQLGLDRNEPLAISIANPSFFVAAVFAVLRSGYTAALVKPPMFPLLHSIGVRNLIHDSQGSVLSGGRNIRFDMSWLPRPGQPAPPRKRETRSIGDGGMIFFTSGSTGLPKKVLQSPAALDELMKNPFALPSGPYEKILVMPGLSSTFGFNRTCEILNVGKTACFAPDSHAALLLIDLFKADLVIGSVAQVLGLAKSKKANPSASTESLKAVVAGGGKIATEGVAAVRATLCRNFIKHYGATEAGVVAIGAFDLVQHIPDAVGYVLPWAELEIVDESGQVLPAEAEGLIRYRTPRLLENLKMAGAAGLPNVRDQWFYPGDIGSITAEGILRLAGRSSDVINRGGVKVSGTKIEEVLQALPGVKEAAAVGILGDSNLEEFWIAIVANGSIEVAEIKRCLLEHNELGIEPDEVFVVDELPRGELGKVQKYRLREQLVRRKKGA